MALIPAEALLASNLVRIARKAAASREPWSQLRLDATVFAVVCSAPPASLVEIRCRHDISLVGVVNLGVGRFVTPAARHLHP